MAYGGNAYGSAPIGGMAGVGGVPAVDQDLTLTLHAPVVHISVLPPSQSLALTLILPNISKNPIPVFLLNLTLNAPIPHVTTFGATFPLAFTIHAPFVKYDKKVFVQRLQLGLKVGEQGQLQPRIVRYIKDPIVRAGCPQCGTYLYNEGPSVRSSEVSYGRNFDNGDYNDNNFVRCVRCGFICNTTRDSHAPRESRVSWGINYVEVEAGS